MIRQTNKIVFPRFPKKEPVTDLQTLTNPGGATGDLLHWNGTAWQRLAAGSEGQVLKTVDGLPEWGGTGRGYTSVTTQTADYTIALADKDCLIKADSVSAIIITIPNNTDVDFEVGSVVDVLRANTGSVTIEGDTGVAINNPDGVYTLREQHSPVSLVKTAANTWAVWGDVTA